MSSYTALQIVFYFGGYVQYMIGISSCLTQKFTKKRKNEFLLLPCFNHYINLELLKMFTAFSSVKVRNADVHIRTGINPN